MSAAGGPRITSDNLVLCLDAHDAKSYQGEPTTNRMTIYDGNLPNYWNTTTYSSYTAVNMRTPVGRKAHKLTLDKDGTNGYYGSPNPCRLTSSPSWSNNGLDHYYSMWITTDNWSKLDGSTYKYVTGSNGWPGFSATSRRARVGGREWRLYKGFISAASNTGSGSEYFTFYKSGTYTEDMVFYIAGTMVHQNGNYATPVGSGTRSTTDAWKDRSGNGNHGDFSGGIKTGVDHHRNGQVIEPKSNAYLDFDGTDDYVSIPHSSAIMLARTWSCWFYLDSIPDSSTYDSIFQKASNWNSHGGTMLSLIYGNLRFGWGTYWAADCSISISGNVTTGKWYHFTGTSTGDTTSGGVKMYLGGVLKDTGTANGVPTDTSILKIGSGSGGPINGRIANFTLYSTELTAAQIKANFNAQRGRYGV
jgi:hypothetical protein